MCVYVPYLIVLWEVFTTVRYVVQDHSSAREKITRVLHIHTGECKTQAQWPSQAENLYRPWKGPF